VKVKVKPFVAAEFRKLTVPDDASPALFTWKTVADPDPHDGTPDEVSVRMDVPTEFPASSVHADPFQ
jgi:hypothetical protein